MNIEWDITKTNQQGGGWVVRRRVTREVVSGDTDRPDTLQASRVVDSVRYDAFTTLAHARKAIATELNLDKRVRLSKHSESHYTYGFPAQYMKSVYA